MVSDHLVSQRGEEDIAGYTERLREKLDIGETKQVDINSVIAGLVGQKFQKKGCLSLELFQKSSGEVRDAFVSFNPLMIHLEEEIWAHARIGDPWSRFVIAHELGHACLHDIDAKAFSGKDSGFGLFGIYEVSAEWQADTFAGHFLVPDHIAATSHSAEELAFLCNVEIKRALARLDSVKARKLWMPKDLNYSGDVCANCGNFMLFQVGRSYSCSVCGIIQS